MDRAVLITTDLKKISYISYELASPVRSTGHKCKVKAISTQ